MHLVRDGYPRAVAPVSSETISSHFDSCVDLSRKDAFCCSSSRNVSTKWCLTGLFQFPVPAAEGGSNLTENSPYAALVKSLRAARFKAQSVQGHLLSGHICAFVLCLYMYICLV